MKTRLLNDLVIGGLAFFLVVLAWLAFTGCNDGRRHGANIPIDPAPTCVELVTDECVPEVIAEFCETCETCEVCEVCPDPIVCPPPECFVEETAKVCVQYRHGWCCKWETETTLVPIDCPTPELAGTERCTTVCRRTPNGSQVCETVCRGGSYALACDRNCEPNDPICIPCDLEERA